MKTPPNRNLLSIPFLVFLFFGNCLIGAPVVLTNQAGNSIEVTITAGTDSEVTVTRESDGNSFVIKMDTLNDESRKLVIEWLESNKPSGIEKLIRLKEDGRWSCQLRFFLPEIEYKPYKRGNYCQFNWNIEGEEGEGVIAIAADHNTDFLTLGAIGDFMDEQIAERAKSFSTHEKKKRPNALIKKPVRGTHFEGYSYQAKNEDRKYEYRLTDGKLYIELSYINARQKGPIGFDEIEAIIQNMETIDFEKAE